MSGPRAVFRHPACIPLLAWGCAVVVLVLVAGVRGYSPWDSATWSRWDSEHYENIARNGYDLFRCSDEPTDWCGDAAWFPAYPWIVGGLHAMGLPLRGTAVLASWVLAAGTLVLLWATFLERRSGSAVVAALFYAAFAPGQIYHYSVFPLSLLTFTTVAFLWLLYRERYVVAGFAGVVAALSYPAGVLLAPVSAVWLLAQSGVPLRERLRRTAITSGLTIAGLCILMIDQRVETGRWNAFLLVQEKYQSGLHHPLIVTLRILKGGAQNLSDGRIVAISVQTALVTVVLALVLAHTFRRRPVLGRLDLLLLLWALAAWALPLSQAVWSIHRGQAVLLPLAVLVARFPSRLAWSLALAAVAVAVWMELYFLDGSLV